MLKNGVYCKFFETIFKFTLKKYKGFEVKHWVVLIL